MARICEELCGGRVSPETVSRYVQELDAELEPWRTWELGEVEFPYLLLDARYEKCRVDHHEDWITGRRYIDMTPLRAGERNRAPSQAGTLTPVA